MAQSADTLFERLESALADWASDVESTHEHLAARVESARERAVSVPEREVEVEQVAATLQANKAQFTTLQETLRQCTDAAKQALAHTEELDKAFAMLEEDVRGLKHMAAHIGATQSSFDGMGAEAASETISELRAVLDEQRDRVSRLEQHISNTEGSGGPTQQQWSRLERDFARLRGEVSRLRGEGVSSDSHTAAYSDTFDEVAEPDELDLNLTGFDKAGRRRRMGEMLIEANVLSDAQLERALSIQQEQPQRRLGSILIELGYTEGDIIAQVLASQAKVPFVRLDKDEPVPAAVKLVSERLASHHVCIPLRLEEDRLILAMANPMDLIAIQDIEHATGRGVDPVASSSDGIVQAIKAYYGVEAR
ncbi:MAG: hypothetical protein IT366_22100 [Candidatus Hydrogenedentes bacterium]|nr:hypothetical protein [Candidatus Hydrogenedentota bacterium]